MRNPDHAARRTIIREWMALPRDKRASNDQAQAFAAKAAERHDLKSPGDRSAHVMAWLMPRVGRS